jgi:hypothetical protein
LPSSMNVIPSSMGESKYREEELEMPNVPLRKKVSFFEGFFLT